MKTRTVAAALLLALAPVAGTGGRIAFAQSAEDPTTKAARARFQEGVDYFDKGQYENARAAFLQAYALRKHPAVLINLAQSSLRSGHVLEAAKYFQQYLRESTSLTTAQRTDAEKGLADARSKLGRVEVSAPTGSEVAVDGDHVGTAPLSELVDVEPGMHKVTIRTTDGNSDARSVSVAAGQTASAKFALASSATVPPVTPPPPGGTETPAPTGGTPGESMSPPSESATGSGGAPNEGPGANEAPGAGRVPVYPAIVGGAVTGVGIVLAIALGIGKSNAQSSATDVANEIRANGGTQGTCFNTPPTSRFYNACATLSSDNSKVNTDAAIANVGIGVGIVGAAFTAFWVVWMLTHGRSHKDVTPPPSSPSPSAASVTPLIGPHLSGLGFGGSF